MADQRGQRPFASKNGDDLSTSHTSNSSTSTATGIATPAVGLANPPLVPQPQVHLPEDPQWGMRIQGQEGTQHRPVAATESFEQQNIRYPTTNRNGDIAGYSGDARVLTCANCGSLNHRLGFCSLPVDESGSIYGCPIHNTRLHTYDTCCHPKATSYESRVKYLFRQRNGLPPIFSTLKVEYYMTTEQVVAEATKKGRGSSGPIPVSELAVPTVWQRLLIQHRAEATALPRKGKHGNNAPLP